MSHRWSSYLLQIRRGNILVQFSGFHFDSRTNRRREAESAPWLHEKNNYHCSGHLYPCIMLSLTPIMFCIVFHRWHKGPLGINRFLNSAAYFFYSTSSFIHCHLSFSFEIITISFPVGDVYIYIYIYIDI